MPLSRNSSSASPRFSRPSSFWMSKVAQRPVSNPLNLAPALGFRGRVIVVDAGHDPNGCRLISNLSLGAAGSSVPGLGATPRVAVDLRAVEPGLFDSAAAVSPEIFPDHQICVGLLPFVSRAGAAGQDFLPCRQSRSLRREALLGCAAPCRRGTPPHAAAKSPSSVASIVTLVYTLRVRRVTQSRNTAPCTLLRMRVPA